MGASKRDAVGDSHEPDGTLRKGISGVFFSREEQRAHVHIQHSSGEAKFWLDPEVELANNFGLTVKRLNIARIIIEDHLDEIKAAWQKHFEG